MNQPQTVQITPEQISDSYRTSSIHWAGAVALKAASGAYEVQMNPYYSDLWPTDPDKEPTKVLTFDHGPALVEVMQTWAIRTEMAPGTLAIDWEARTIEYTPTPGAKLVRQGELREQERGA